MDICPLALNRLRIRARCERNMYGIFFIGLIRVQQSNVGSYALRVTAEALTWDAGRGHAADRGVLDRLFRSKGTLIPRHRERSASVGGRRRRRGVCKYGSVRGATG
jgi:hypothetical protein